jgi:hypothetical protein
MIHISSVPHSHGLIEEGLLGPYNPVGHSYMLDIYKIGTPRGVGEVIKSRQNF